MQHSNPRPAISAVAEHAGIIPLVIVGLPSSESIFTVHCLADIVRRTRGGVVTTAVNTAEDSDRLAELAAGEPVIVFSDVPDALAREALLATRAPIVAVMGGFAETAQFSMVTRDLDALQAARFVSQSFSCLEPLRRVPGVRSVTLDKAADLKAWIDEASGWLGLRADAWRITRQQMLDDYACWPTVGAAINGLLQSADAVPVTLEQGSSSTCSLFDTLGKFYHAGSINTLFWPAECLLVPGEPAVPVCEAIAFAGPARILTFGPFFHVPPGRWCARYEFETDGHPAGNLMEFDIVNGGNVLVSRQVLVDRAGRFAFDCEFDLEHARLPVEYRAFLAEGSIGGWFRPLGIWLSRNA